MVTSTLLGLIPKCHQMWLRNQMCVHERVCVLQCALKKLCMPYNYWHILILQRRRSLKKNFIPQINLAASFFPHINKWKEKKNQKWMPGPEMHIKFKVLNNISVIISRWNWGSLSSSVYAYAILSLKICKYLSTTAQQ